MYYIQPSLASDDSIVHCQECFLYTYTGVGLSALLVSTNWAMPEPLHVERVTEQALRFFVCISECISSTRESVDFIVYGIRMNILQNNPYRLLGVYSNSPTKERLANHNRMKAFLKVGKSVSFPLDVPQYLTSINRTEASIADAEAKLTLPKDQILYAQFWFIKATPLDEVAFNHLFAGEIDQAEEIWQKRECLSALQNRIVCALIRNKYDHAIMCAEVLYGNTQYLHQFVSTIIGTGGNFDVSNLTFSFLDMLCDEIGASKLLPFITNSSWKEYLGEKTVKPLVDSIQEAINIAQKSKGKGSNARLKAGEALRENTRKSLMQLRTFLSTTDLQYQMIADKLGLEILQCGIDYFNDSEEPDAAYKAMSLQDYAKSIVVGQMAKDRCKENVDILQRIIDNLPPSEVFMEDRAIHEELRKYCLLPDKICHAVTLLNNAKPHLQSIKRKLGESNAYYLKISTQIVGNALSNVIAEVNEAHSIFSTDRDDPNAALAAILGISHVKSVLEEAWEATRIMDGFDMEADYKSRRYSKNLAILEGLCEQLGVSTYTPSSLSSRPIRREPTSTARSYASTTNRASANRQTTPSSSSSSSSSDNGCLLGIIFMIIGAAILGAITESGGGAAFGGLIGLGIWSKISN